MNSHRLSKSKNSVGQILGFHCFSKNIVGRAISVCDVTDDLWSGNEADFHREHMDFLSSEPGSQKVYFGDFFRIFLKCVVVCPLKLQGIYNMWICPILSPYFGGPWSWTEYKCHNGHALVVCDQADGQVDFPVSVLQG